MLRWRIAPRIYIRSDGRVDRIAPLVPVNALFCSATCSRGTGSRIDLVERLGFISRPCSCLADARVAVAAMRLSRHYPLAVRHMWNDTLRHPIFSWSPRGRIKVESTGVRSAMLGYRFRCLRAGDFGGARATSENLFVKRPRQEIFACLSDLCGHAELDLFAPPLAQFLGRRLPSRQV